MKTRQTGKRSAAICVRLLALVVCAVLVGTILMISLYALPTGSIFAHARASVDDFDEEMIFNWAGQPLSGLLCYQTDALMIAHAIYRPHDSVVENAMINPRPEYDLEPQENLVRYLQGEEPIRDSRYDRYWHGYLLYIIPLLQFLTVGEAKIVMMYLQFFLLMMVVCLLGKRSRAYMFLFTVVVLFLNPITSVLTFQNADIHCIMLVSMILLLRYNDWLKINGRYLYFFALNGILVAFMDYLTYPLAAYGVPLITVLLINDFRGREALKHTVLNSLAWGWGYGGMWAGKWIMAELLTDADTLSSALRTIFFRTSGGVGQFADGEITFGFTLKHVFGLMMDRPTWILVGITGIILVICIFRKKSRYKTIREYLAAAGAVALVGMVPFAWFFVVRNHTVTHPHLEYRQLAVSLWAVLVILTLPFINPAPETEQPGCSV